jgi:hypothetical protein
MNSKSTESHDQWGRSVLTAARRWVYIPLGLAIVGAVAGGYVGSVAKPSAEALLLVKSEAIDGQGMERTVESEALQLKTQTLFDMAAGRAGVTPDSLRARTKIGAKPNTQIISIKITAPSTAQAIREASAVANAAVEQVSADVPAQLEQITDETRKLIRDQKLPNKDAERARLAKLGDDLASRLSGVLDRSQQLDLLQAGEPTRLVPSTPIMAAMGGLAGALLGLALAQLLGVRRGTIKSGRELSQLYPDATVIAPAELENMITIEPKARTVFLAGVRRGSKELDLLTETVRRSLTSSGRDVFVRTGAPSLDQPTNGHIDLIPTTLSATVLRRTARDDEALLIVSIQPRVTRLEALDAFVPQLSERSYLLVDEQTPEWD